jgi:hypothetical protein
MIIVTFGRISASSISADPHTSGEFRSFLAEMPGSATTYKGEADALREQTGGTRP